MGPVPYLLEYAISERYRVNAYIASLKYAWRIDASDKSKDQRRKMQLSLAKKNEELEAHNIWAAIWDEIDDNDDVDVRFGTCYDFSFHCKLFAPHRSGRFTIFIPYTSAM